MRFPIDFPCIFRHHKQKLHFVNIIHLMNNINATMMLKKTIILILLAALLDKSGAKKVDGYKWCTVVKNGVCVN